MNSVIITEETVLSNMKTMNVNKATGPDGISVRVLKEFANELSPILSKIVCFSYKQGKYPNAWKNGVTSSETGL